MSFGNINVCPTDYCAWDDWVIGDCSVSCGGGTRTNFRTSKASAAHGDVECNEETISIQENCNLHHCPGKKSTCNIVLTSNKLVTEFVECLIVS